MFWGSSGFPLGKGDARGGHGVPYCHKNTTGIISDFSSAQGVSGSRGSELPRPYTFCSGPALVTHESRTNF